MNKTAGAVVAAIAIATGALMVSARPDSRCARVPTPYRPCVAIRDGQRKFFRAGVIVRAPFEGPCEAVKDCTGHEQDEEKFGP